MINKEESDMSAQQNDGPSPAARRAFAEEMADQLGRLYPDSTFIVRDADEPDLPGAQVIPLTSPPDDVQP